MTDLYPFLDTELIFRQEAVKSWDFTDEMIDLGKQIGDWHDFFCFLKVNVKRVNQHCLSIQYKSVYSQLDTNTMQFYISGKERKYPYFVDSTYGTVRNWRNGLCHILRWTPEKVRVRTYKYLNSNKIGRYK